MAQQIAGGDRADDFTRSVVDAQMSESQTLHAADGAVDESILGDGLQRSLHDHLDGCRHCALAALVECAQEIALGDDACHARRRAHEHAAHPLLDQQPHGVAHRRLRWRKQGRSAHDVAH